jgi:hypothetical protein
MSRTLWRARLGVRTPTFLVRPPESDPAFQTRKRRIDIAAFITLKGSDQLSVQPAVGDLVDARLPPLRRVPLADSDEDEGRLRRFFVAGQHSSPPPSGTRKIGLDAAAEASPISPFLFAAPSLRR